MAVVVSVCKKNYQEAISYNTKAIQLNPKSATAHYNRAGIYSHLKNYQSAIADYTKALQLEKDIYWNVYLERGLAYKKLGKTREAIADYSQMIKIDPELGEAYFQRAQIYQSLGNKKAAIVDFKQAKVLLSKPSEIDSASFYTGMKHRDMLDIIDRYLLAI